MATAKERQIDRDKALVELINTVKIIVEDNKKIKKALKIKDEKSE